MVWGTVFQKHKFSPLIIARNQILQIKTCTAIHYSLSVYRLVLTNCYWKLIVFSKYAQLCVHINMYAKDGKFS